MTSGQVDVDEHLGLVFQVARLVARRGGGRRYDPAELIGAGYNGLVDAAKRYDPTRGASFPTFARRRVWGAIVEQLRRETHWRSANRPVFTSLDTALPSLVVFDPEPKELGSRVTAALAALEPRLCRVVILRFFGDLNYAQIGARLGVSEARVCQLLRQALLVLRVAVRHAPAGERARA